LRGLDSGIEIIIRDAVQEKLRYVNEDEFEQKKGIRELLNFGHTFAHGFEAATGFTQLLHGEAVALGMRAATWLSMELGLLSENEWSEVEIVLGRLPIPGEVTFTVDEAVQKMRRDKKNSAHMNRFVLLESVGKAVIRENIDEKHIKKAIEFVLSVI
jgi:3-dehydroquinate synthetase